METLIAKHQSRRLWLPVLACWLALGPSLIIAQPAPSEYQVKAAYLFSFGRFISWRANTSSDPAFPICILGRDPFGPALDDTVRGEAIDGKHVVVRRPTSPKDAEGCRILFVSETRDMRAVLAELPAGILTVSDAPDFNERGGMIQFILDNRRVRFAVNLEAAERGGLLLSSELLKVAISVTRNPKGGGNHHD